jgi:hypothetical protein
VYVHRYPPFPPNLCDWYLNPSVFLVVVSNFVKMAIAAGTAEMCAPKSMTLNLKEMFSGAALGGTLVARQYSPGNLGARVLICFFGLL